RLTECHRRDERPQLQLRRPLGEPGERRPRVEDGARLLEARDVVVGAEERLDTVLLAGVGKRRPVIPGDALLALDHHGKAHEAQAYSWLEPACLGRAVRCAASIGAWPAPRRSRTSAASTRPSARPSSRRKGLSSSSREPALARRASSRTASRT